jgi:hypothetical protein
MKEVFVEEKIKSSLRKLTTTGNRKKSLTSEKEVY